MSDIVARILERDPDWAALPAATPDAVHRVLRWALAKDPQRRLRDRCRCAARTGNAGHRRVSRRPGRASPPVGRCRGVDRRADRQRHRRRGRLAHGCKLRLPDSTRLTSQFAIPVGPLEVLPRNVAISPDGRYIAYLAGPPGNQKTYLRVSAIGSRGVIAELPMQARQPFFSPDSQWVAFFDAGKLKKLPRRRQVLPSRSPKRRPRAAGPGGRTDRLCSRRSPEAD